MCKELACILRPPRRAACRAAQLVECMHRTEGGADCASFQSEWHVGFPVHPLYTSLFTNASGLYIPWREGFFYVAVSQVALVRLLNRQAHTFIAALCHFLKPPSTMQ